MSNRSQSKTHEGAQYVFFDKGTGKVLQTYSRLDVDADKPEEISREELLREFRADAALVAQLTDEDAENLDVLEAAPLGVRAYVDLDTRQLLAMPSFRLKAAKRQLEGDGQDSTTLEIQVVDASGRPNPRFEGEVQVSTERGKLSERSGILSLVQGRAALTLTSVSETVSKVRVRVRALDDALVSPGSLDLEFV